ncbi:TonB-dependent receptor [Cyclobacterium qasimii M12-11B]|uniref:TonB-dependent receptor n=2 Tax=Cyclobacterium qasimii TaxID=1350429 RepID=S7WSJ6_9BACT|nr:TonB-dependent receptor [Cyclobacterium qasimii M12-11B]
MAIQLFYPNIHKGHAHALYEEVPTIINSSENNAEKLNLMADVTVTGTVTDQNGEPIPGATISLPGTTIGTATDLDGKYSLTVPEASELVFPLLDLKASR